MIDNDTTKNWWLYIIETANNKLYTGITKDIDRRFKEHMSGGKKAARFFRTDKPRSVVFKHACTSHSEALKLEIKIKALTKQQKHLLISGRQAIDK